MCDILPFTGRQNRKKKSLTGESILAPAQRNFLSAFVAGQQISKKVSKKPIQPSEEELAENPRSRSAKLRVCEKNLGKVSRKKVFKVLRKKFCVVCEVGRMRNQDKKRMLTATVIIGFICIIMVVLAAYAAELRVENNSLINSNEALQGEIDTLSVKD